MDAQYQKVVQAIEGVKSALLVSHYNPDPDAISSTTGAAFLLKYKGVQCFTVNFNQIDPRYFFIPGAAEILDAIPSNPFDAIVVLDSATIDRVGDLFLSRIKSHKKVINIDHHRTNTNFGSINLVDQSASSCCEVLFNLMRAMAVRPDPDLATALLTGIVSDTGSFRYSNTSPTTLRVAAELCEAGANLRNISTNLFERKSKEATLLQSALLSKVDFIESGKIAWVTCSLDELEKSRAHPDDLDPVVEEARCVEGVEIAVLCREQKVGSSSKWRVSLRGKGDGADLGAIAKKFGGGGHKSAAGFFFEGKLEKLRSELIHLL